MAIDRDFKIKNEEQSLTLYTNAQNMIYLNVGDINDEHYYQGYITLNKNDALELSYELKRLANKLKDFTVITPKK